MDAFDLKKITFNKLHFFTDVLNGAGTIYPKEVIYCSDLDDTRVFYMAGAAKLPSTPFTSPGLSKTF